MVFIKSKSGVSNRESLGSLYYSFIFSVKSSNFIDYFLSRVLSTMDVTYTEDENAFYVFKDNIIVATLHKRYVDYGVLLIISFVKECSGGKVWLPANRYWITELLDRSTMLTVKKVLRQLTGYKKSQLRTLPLHFIKSNNEYQWKLKNNIVFKVDPEKQKYTFINPGNIIPGGKLLLLEQLKTDHELMLVNGTY